MAVLFPTCTLGVQRPEFTYDAFGAPVPESSNDLPVSALRPGRADEQPDGTWVLAADPDCWPVRVGDVLVEGSTGAKWVVKVADLRRNSELPEVDFVRVEAVEVTATGVEPGGVDQAGRRR